MKTFKDILMESKEKKLNAKDLVNMFKIKEDWGDQGDYVKVVKGNLEVLDSWYYGGDDALNKLIKTWTDPKGTNAMFFKEKYNITFKLIDTIYQVKATGRYKKAVGPDGVIGVILKVE